MAEQGKVKLMTSDNVECEVEYDVALQMETVKNFIQLAGRDAIMPVHNVSSAMLSKVIQYVQYHLEAKESGKSEEEVKNWDRQFADVDQPTLYAVLMASNYLTINDLFEFLCETVADKIRDFSPELLLELFDIRCEYNEEEQKKIISENAWAYNC